MASLAEIAQRARQQQSPSHQQPRSLSAVAAEARYPQILAAAEKVMDPDYVPPAEPTRTVSILPGGLEDKPFGFGLNFNISPEIKKAYEQRDREDLKHVKSLFRSPEDWADEDISRAERLSIWYPDAFGPDEMNYILAQRHRKWQQEMKAKGKIGLVEALGEKDTSKFLGITGNWKAIPFQPKDAVETTRLAYLTYKASQDKATPEELLEIRNYLLDMEEEDIRGTTLWAKVGRILSQLPGFALEFMATGGLYAAGKKGGRKASIKILKKHLRKKLARKGIKTIGALSGTALRTMAMPHRITEAAARRKIAGGIAYDKTGKLTVTDTGDSWGEALAKGVGDTYIENLSEIAGPTIGKSAGKLLKYVPGKSKLGKLLSKMPKGELLDRITSTMAKFGYHGPLEEMSEERFGDFLRAAFGIGKWSDVIPEADQLAAEGIAFTLPAIGAYSASAVDTKLTDIKNQREYKKFLLTPTGSRLFAREKPQQAQHIAQKTHPSRKDLEATGIKRMSKSERGKFAQQLRDVLKKDQLTAEQKTKPKLSVVAEKGYREKIIDKWGPDSKQVEALNSLEDYYGSEGWKNRPWFTKWVGRIVSKTGYNYDRAVDLANEAINDSYELALAHLLGDGSSDMIDYARQAIPEDGTLAEAILVTNRRLFTRAAGQIIRGQQRSNKQVSIVGSEEAAEKAGVAEESLEGELPVDVSEGLKPYSVREAFERLRSLVPNYLGQNRIKSDDANYRILAEIADNILSDENFSPLNETERKQYLTTRQKAINSRIRPFAAYYKIADKKQRVKLEAAWEKARDYLHNEAIKRWERRHGKTEPTQAELTKGITIIEVPEVEPYKTPLWTKYGVPGWLNRTGAKKSWRWVYPDRSKSVLIVDPKAVYIPGSATQIKKDKNGASYRWIVHQKGVNWSKMLTEPGERISRQEAEKRRGKLWQQIQKTNKTLAKKITPTKKMNAGTANEETAMKWAKDMFEQLKAETPELTTEWLKEARRPAKTVYEAHRTWGTDIEGNPVNASMGRYTTLREAQDAYRKAHIDRFGVEPSQESKGDMPRKWAWPDWKESQDWLKKVPVIPQELTIVGKELVETAPEVDKMLDKLTRNKWIGQVSDIEFSNKNPVATEQESINSNGQRWTNEQRQKGNSIRIAGSTRYSKSGGRIRITIYRSGLGSVRTIAEEIYHIGFEIIRQSMPGTYKQVRQWYADRLKQGFDPSIDISEAFAKEMALAEITRKSTLPREVIKTALELVHSGKKLSSKTAQKVTEAFQKVQFSVTDRDRGETSKPSDYTETSAAAFAVEPAETKQGGKLLEKLKADAASKHKKKVGPRSIVEFVNDLFQTPMLVGRTQTTKRYPAHFERAPHIIRSRSGVWQLNFHEAGHALSNLLSDSKRSWYKKFAQALKELTFEPGSMASAKTSEEGMAELVRKYITDYKSIPAKLLQDFEATLSEIAPDLLAGLRDAHRAYSFWRSRPIIEQLETIQTDKPPKQSRVEAVSSAARRAIYNLIGGSTVINRLVRNSFRAVAAQSRWSALDITGAVGLIRSKLSRAYHSQLEMARQFRQELIDSPADVESAYQATLHIVQETQRSLYGVKKGREGIRVYSTGKGFAELTEQEIQTLKNAGFIIPKEKTAHGQWIYLSDKSISAIKHEVGFDNWDAFVLYGQYRAAMERYKEKGQDYPGRADGLTPEKINTWLRQQEKENPDWHGHFKKINEYMDQLLLVAVLSGEYTAKEAATIKKAWADYWPLPRQIEDRPQKRSGAGAEPTSGVRGASGSPLPFATLDEAVESRTKMALEAYYTNRLMLAMRNFSKKLGSLKQSPFSVRKQALRLMLPLHLETKKAATLTDAEQGEIIADYLNEQIARRMGITVAELKLSGSYIEADDIEISTPGRPVWRAGKPSAVHIIAPFENGKRRYYQLTDPLLFDLLTKGRKPSKYFNWLTHAMINMIAPWRRALTQNIGFALANTLSRDPANAGFMGKDDTKALIPFFYAGTGLINRLKGKGINMDATSQSELLSKALDHTNKDAHQGIVGSFKEMLKEGILVQNYNELSFGEKVIEAPGQLMSMLMKPIDIFNWLSGGRWLSETGEELPREGAYVAAAQKGRSPERSQLAYDYITGNFGQKGGSAATAAVVRSAGFLNPGLQIMAGQAARVLDPDPKVRAFNVGAKIPALMLWGAIGAAINYLIILAANPDDDERKEILDQMRERPDENRLGYMAVGGRIRLPFDYGLIGAVVSYGWNSVEEWLLDDPIKAEKKAKVLLNRARDIPGITDIINPYIKTGAELWLNHSFFYDDDIVPAWMEGAYPYNPEMQTWPSMPEIYNKMGRGLRVSPIKLRYAIRQLFTQQMDDVLKLVDKIAGGKPYHEPADYPVVGRLIDRRSEGFQSQSVKALSDIDRDWQMLNVRLRDIKKRHGRNDDYKKLQEQISELDLAHTVMTDIEKTWQQVKDERIKQKPDYQKIRQLKQQMTRTARVFVKWQGSGRKGKLPPDIFSDDTLGNIVYQFTDPPVIRKNKGESNEDFEERKTQRQQSIERAEDILSQINLDKKQLRALLKKEAIQRSGKKREPLKWRGDYRSEYGNRLLRINKFN